MTLINDRVEVSVDKTGSPIGFSWKGGHYLVNSKPVRWFARKQWWVESARVQRGIGAGVLEVEMWRMIAADPAKKQNQFELVHDAMLDVWRLVRVYE
ncbi:unannotated protein [freshwater metagenome]|uniref:Unannotated protein n=1 Tax=freshwater metagenome TaxID=449393 RepID=A0A6J7K989_9ZZZZ|nr:hypothetical protein [Actinomycetota bacterium]